MLKAFLRLCVIALLFAGLSTAAGAQSVKLEFTAIASGERLTFYQAAVESFERLNPDIDIEFFPKQGGLQDYVEQLTVLAAADAFPDILITPFQGTLLFGRQNLLADLTPWIDKDREDVALDDIIEPALLAGRVDGAQYSLPVGLETLWVTYNVDAFLETGLMRPDELYESGGWTFDSLREISDKLTKRRPDGSVERWGMVTSPSIEPVQGWIWGTGGQLYDDETRRIVLNEDGAVAGLEFLRQMVQEDETTALAGGPVPYRVGLRPVTTQGMVGLNPWWHGVVSTYTDWGVPFAVDQAPFPRGPVSEQNIVALSDAVAMSSGTEHPEAAWRFVKWYSKNVAELPNFNAAVGHMPPRYSQLGDWMSDRIAQGIPGARFFMEATTRIRHLPLVSPDVQRAVDDVLTALWAGALTTRAAADEATSAGNRALEAERR